MKTATAPAISLAELRERLDAAALDVCDQSEIIKIAMDKAEGSHDAVFALLRSIKSFNDQIFSKLQSIVEELEKQPQQGGA